MPVFARPNVFASRCLGFAACRYNGVSIPVGYVERLKPHVNFITTCPEMDIGLGVPRDPIRIIEKEEGNPRLVQPATGKELTDKMIKFADRYLSSLRDMDGFILKEASPSCGMKGVKRYPDEGKVAPKASRGPGFFGGEVVKRFPWAAIEDEGRMRNFRLREHFYTRLFTLARFRQVKASDAMSEVVHFHASHKFLLMAYNQEKMRILGRIVANSEKKRFTEIISTYQQHFHEALASLPRYTSNINVLMHALGYFELSKEEKSYFLGLLERYRARKIPLSACLSVVNSWIVRFGQPYLADQVFFEPYPANLVVISDSGKGRDL